MENQRIRLTKTLLKNALLALLEKKPIERIAVSEICAQAQVYRTTFYKYYGSQYDLLAEIEKDHFEKLEEALSESGGNGEDALYRVLEALLDDQKSYRILTGVLPDRDFSEKLFNLPTIRRKIDAAIPETFSETEREQVRLFFYQGGYAVIRDWLNRDERESPKKLSAFLNGIIEKMLQF